MHPHDMEVPALAHYIKMGLDDAFVIDFLSERAQNSLINFLAMELKKFYDFISGPYKEMEWPENSRWLNANTPFFLVATKRHPLYALFGDVLANAVQMACDPLFTELERQAKVDALA